MHIWYIKLNVNLNIHYNFLCLLKILSMPHPYLLCTHLPVITNGFSLQEPVVLWLMPLSASKVYACPVHGVKGLGATLNQWWARVGGKIPPLPAPWFRVPQQDGALVSHNGTLFINKLPLRRFSLPASFLQSPSSVLYGIMFHIISWLFALESSSQCF